MPAGKHFNQTHHPGLGQAKGKVEGLPRRRGLGVEQGGSITKFCFFYAGAGAKATGSS
jgi:hypothetical protein